MYRAAEKKGATEGEERTPILPLLDESVCVSGRFLLRYLLYVTDGKSRALYGTTCERIYCLRVVLTHPNGFSEQCDLPDIAREEAQAKEVFFAFLRGLVTPCAAEEIYGEILASALAESKRA